MISLPIHKNLNIGKVETLDVVKGRFDKETNDLYLITPLGWGYNIDFYDNDNTGDLIGSMFVTKLLNNMVVINNVVQVCTDKDTSAPYIQHGSRIIESVTTKQLDKWMEKLS